VYCPYCKFPDSRVTDTRLAEDGSSIRRRRQCPQCERRFTTVEQTQLAVVKRSGAVEPFLRDKVVAGVRKACKGRPVSEGDLARLGEQVEDSIRSLGLAEVPAQDIGLAILAPLRAMDEVVYLRFASVYESYASVEDFETGIAELRDQRLAR
jgi:transcriptional repressor NrdR